MQFSERYGYKKVREIIQIDSIDEPLRNGLWSLLKIHVWDNICMSSYGLHYLSDRSNSEIKQLCVLIWFHFFKEPLDQLDDKWDKAHQCIREFFFRCEWYEVYDFLEFVSINYDDEEFQDTFNIACNKVLESEMSAFRFVDGLISRITEQHEVDEIEQALETALGPVHTHLRRALELLSSRDNPDYRNSIKESISAVESQAQIVTGVPKGTLGMLTKKLEKDIQLHPALSNALNSMYGYTSDEGGIRHALMDSENIRFEDAKFFLVICSAFINYVVAKLPEADVTVGGADKTEG